MTDTRARTDEQAFADSMDMALDRQARRAYSRPDAHWKKISVAIEAVRGLVRQHMNKEDRENTK